MSFSRRTPRVPTTLQVSQTECGLCCIRSILSAYGHETTITALRQRKEPGRDGLGLQQMMQLLRGFGMEADTLRVNDVRGLDIIDCPFIAFWKGGHYVAVESIGPKTATVMDPAIGRIKMTRAELIAGFDRYVLVASPGAEFIRCQRSWTDRWRKGYIWPEGAGWRYLEMGLTSGLLVALTLSIPLATQRIVDEGFAGRISFARALIVLCVGALIMFALSYCRTRAAVGMVRRFGWHLSRNAFVRLLSLPARYFTVRAPGEVVYRLNALNRLPDLLGVTLIQGMLDLLSGLAVLVYIFWTSPLVGVIAIMLVGAMVCFLALSQPVVNRAMDSELHEGTSAQSVQLDALVSINSVKLGGYVGTYIRDWETSFRRLLLALSRRMNMQGVIGSVLSSTQAFAPLALLVICIDLVQRDLISMGQAVAVQAVSSLLFGYVQSAFSTWTDTQLAGRYLDLAEDIFEYPEERVSGSKREISSGRIEAKHLSFRYAADSPDALCDISLSVAAGETIALVGVSGSGKTTLGKVLCSLFEPTSGSLAIDGVDVKEYDLAALRKRISYIPQEAHLHNRTILENLRLGCDLPDEDIMNFCRKIGFLDFIDSFPMDYRTPISELGANLSGGQCQRIHIARVLLQSPALLIMDEATSSLDNITQRNVYERLATLSCTKIVIAHRFATILNADRVVVLQDGEIVQEGRPTELMRQQGRYADLFRFEIGDVDNATSV
ncbi:peptidase domain-containing ABC transporter [Actinomyces sp. Z3]|uniref:peptidase domain-containing ABC transporter n=1 Tax=Actinomyces sp. Z3 TaxID=2250217 RepID=UPI000DCAE3D0|nr:peptidase domain-containing ABC transporter [Actinomyces sp. Z3]RAX22586.1 peptidase domain-containing ABC transporter [Actinomyces sp. Z3]